MTPMRDDWILLGGCTMCGGSGYRKAPIFCEEISAATITVDVLVPCSCLRLKWQREAPRSSATTASTFPDDDCELP